MNNQLILLGAVFVIIGIVVLAFAFLPNTKVETKSAVVGFIGPIPFGFGTDKQMLYVAIAISTILFVAYFIYWFILRKPF